MKENIQFNVEQLLGNDLISQKLSKEARTTESVLKYRLKDIKPCECGSLTIISVLINRRGIEMLYSVHYCCSQFKEVAEKVLKG